MNEIVGSKLPPWRGRGEELLRRMGRRPVQFRLVVLTLGVLYTCWVLWGTSFDNQQGVGGFKGLSGFVLVVTVAWVMPYFIYLAGVRSKPASVAGGAALLLTHLLLFWNITTSQSSTASLGFLTTHMFLSGVAIVAALVDLVASAARKTRSRRTGT